MNKWRNDIVEMGKVQVVCGVRYEIAAIFIILKLQISAE